MKKLDLEIPDYSSDTDPTKDQAVGRALEWNINKFDIRHIKTQYDKRFKEFKKRKSEEKVWKKNSKMIKTECFVKTEVKKEEIKSSIIDLTLDMSEEDDTFTE